MQRGVCNRKHLFEKTEIHIQYIRGLERSQGINSSLFACQIARHVLRGKIGGLSDYYFVVVKLRLKWKGNGRVEHIHGKEIMGEVKEEIKKGKLKEYVDRHTTIG